MLVRAGTLVAFLSGFVALGYEILWARRLSDIIGATSFAASLVVGVFFLALAAGAARLGPLAARHPSPWRLYALLELGIVLCVLPSFFGEQLTTLLAHNLGPALLHPVGGLIVKAGLALLFVAPASFLMGGTLPALGQAVVQADRLGREGNALYGLNTLGGAAGIVTTTFLLAPTLGLRGAFLFLMGGSVLLAFLASRIASVAAPPETAKPAHGPARRRRGAPTPQAAVSFAGWAWIAAVSGFTVLGLEVLALHVFSQVLHNSGYTFATVLIVVITSLAVGALVTQRWELDAAAAWSRLAIVLLLGACATAVTPKLFFVASGGMRPFGGGAAGFALYIARILGVAGLVLGPVFILAGWVFPLVLAGAGTARGPIGERWGRLLGVNAGGALLGLLLANHVAMPILGLWRSITLWSVAMLLTGIWVTRRAGRAGRARGIALAVAAVALLVITAPWSIPVAALAPGDRVVDWRAGPDGVAAVIDRAQPVQERRIKWNNTYSLGGSANEAQQARLGYLPLLLHPQPQRTAFIGLATGITASAALRDPARLTLTVVELSPQITRLACEHFRDSNGNVCEAPRTRVIVEDGRMFLRATRDRFDVVVGDLFVPWRSGVANLYTREHLETVHARLRPGGLFAQWLPLFQLDARGFWGIAATFCEVFPNAWLAIGDFQPHNPAVALIGWRDPQGAPSWPVLEKRCAQLGALPVLREPMLSDPTGVAMFLVGPVAPALPAGVPIMTLDHPWLADHAPRVQRAVPERFFQGGELVASLQRIASHVPHGPLREPVTLGNQIYTFCDILNRDGAERAAAWYRSQVEIPLPDFFRRRDAPRLSWPFTQPTGIFLIQEAKRQARR
jgi:spermidine synthase